MLVDEHRHNSAAGSEDLQRLVPKPALRPLGVSKRSLGIFPVLGNQQHPIDSQVTRAQRERVLNRLTHSESMRSCEQTADVLFRLLVCVERRQLEHRILALAVERVGLKQPAHDQVRVRIVVINSDDGGDVPGRRQVGGLGGADKAEHRCECSQCEPKNLFLRFRNLLTLLRTCLTSSQGRCSTMTVERIFASCAVESRYDFTVMSIDSMAAWPDF